MEYGFVLRKMIPGRLTPRPLLKTHRYPPCPTEGWRCRGGRPPRDPGRAGPAGERGRWHDQGSHDGQFPFAGRGGAAVGEKCLRSGINRHRLVVGGACRDLRILVTVLELKPQGKPDAAITRDPFALPHERLFPFHAWISLGENVLFTAEADAWWLMATAPMRDKIPVFNTAPVEMTGRRALVFRGGFSGDGAELALVFSGNFFKVISFFPGIFDPRQLTWGTLPDFFRAASMALRALPAVLGGIWPSVMKMIASGESLTSMA